MAYDAELADRMRFLIGTGPGVTEKKMFGGLAFLIGGNMAISASGQGGALVRVDPAESAVLTETTTATEAVMGGRQMRGWLRVSSDDLEADDQLAEWVSRAVRYARSLPPKRCPGVAPARRTRSPAGHGEVAELCAGRGGRRAEEVREDPDRAVGEWLRIGHIEQLPAVDPEDEPDGSQAAHRDAVRSQ